MTAGGGIHLKRLKQAVVGIDDLAGFRRYWTGRRVLDLIARHGGKILINWPIGVGKSHNLDDLVEAAHRSGRYDLIVVLVPTRRVLDERRWVRHPPALRVSIVNLRPRSQHNCGEDVDGQWRTLESRGLGLLGRNRLCRPCPSYDRCF
jgi:hypothetical protein